MGTLTLNYWAVAAAALSAFVLGGLWYSNLVFGRVWQKAAGLSDQDLAGRRMGIVFGASFFWSLVMAFDLTFFLAGPTTTPVWGLAAGLLAGIGWAAAGLCIIGLFEARPAKWMLINGGYLALSLGIMGLIIGTWR